MGCENSKTVRVLPVGHASLSRDNTKMTGGGTGTQTPEGGAASHRSNRNKLHKSASKLSEFSLDEAGHKVKRNNRDKSSATMTRTRSQISKDLMGSCDTLECDDDTQSLTSDRGSGSATSKQSTDSGLGEDYAHVITEYSENGRVEEVEKAFKPRDDLEMSITGTQVGTRNSAKDKLRLEEAQVLQSLREEGLITKPHAEAPGGMSFQIVTAAHAAAGDGVPKPPPRLEKLARRRKRNESLTEEQIKEKLEKAERRRKKREQERLDRLKQQRDQRTDQVAALENFTQYQRSKEETLVQRMDQVSDNRDRQLQKLKDKQERRKRHAEEVRRRKAEARERGASASSSLDEEYPGTPRDHTPTPGDNPAAAAMSSSGERSRVVRSPIQVKESKDSSRRLQ